MYPSWFPTRFLFSLEMNANSVEGVWEGENGPTVRFSTASWRNLVGHGWRSHSRTRLSFILLASRNAQSSLQDSQAGSRGRLELSEPLNESVRRAAEETRRCLAISLRIISRGFFEGFGKFLEGQTLVSGGKGSDFCGRAVCEGGKVIF